jgi:hypothetical protein
MTHSLVGADRSTHLKIACLALVGAIAVVTVGMTAKMTGIDTAPTQDLVKAGRPAAFTARYAATVR